MPRDIQLSLHANFSFNSWHKARRADQRQEEAKRADYLLRYTRDFPLAIVEAKVVHKTAGDGMQQAKDYAQILGLQFAYATNGKEILEFDFLTGLETKIVDFPMPKELWDRLKASQQLSEKNTERLLTPSYQISGKPPRYYQEIAINRTNPCCRAARGICSRLRQVQAKRW